MAFGIALIARFFRMGNQSLWVDEIFTLKAIRHVREVDPGHLLRDLHGPLYTAMGALFGGMASGEGLRMISALAGALAVLPLHAWARRVCDPATAALVALMAALSPFAVWYGQELRNYSFVLLFSALCLLTLEKVRSGSPGFLGLGAFVLVAWMGLLSNLTFSLFLIGAGLATIIAAPRKLRTLSWLSLAALLIILLSLPWITTFIQDMEPQRLVVERPEWDEAPLRGETTFTPMAIPYSIYALVGGFSLGPSLAELHRGPVQAIKNHLPLLTIAGSVIAAALLLGWRGLSGRRRIEFALILASVLGLASFLAIKNFKVYNVRYVSMLWPLLLLLMANAAMNIQRRWLGRGLGVGVLVLFCVALSQHYWNPSYAKADLRGAAEELESLVDPGDTVLVGIVTDPFRHYFEASNPVLGLWPGMGTGEIGERLGMVEGKGYLVSARDWEWGGEDKLLSAFVERRVERTATLQGVRIYTLHKVE